MNQDSLISYIKECAQAAESNLEKCEAGFLRILVPKIRVMGERALEPLTLLVDKSIQKAKQIVVPIFGLEGLLLFLLLVLL
jgi:predicted neutral ceramidase superfamily lipid hydrolase